MLITSIRFLPRHHYCERKERKEKKRNKCVTINKHNSIELQKHMALLSMGNNFQEKDVIYLDNNATTHEDKSVIQSMINHLNCSNSFGNPSSSHFLGIKGRNLIDEAREEVRSCINASYSNEIIFTSGGTESNNLAIHGILKSNVNNNCQHVITSPFEHPSVENILKYLQNSNKNIEISFVQIDSNGIIDLQHFRQLLKPQTKLVTIMHSNNEIGLFFYFFIYFKNLFFIGSIQPIEEIVDLCRQYGSSDLIIHSDASQSIGKVPVDVLHLGVDLLTICSHKFHGPKGIGALYIRQGTKLEPILYGAQHEQGLRPGTENVLAIIGLGKACQLISNKYLLNKRIEQKFNH
jgi:cysteine desulfurase